MSKSSNEVASLFAQAIAGGPPGEDPVSLKVPLTHGETAGLGFNGEQGAWILTVAKSVDQQTADEQDRLFESLLTNANQVRFSSAQIASMTADGQATVSTVLAGNRSGEDLEQAVNHALALLAGEASAAVTPSAPNQESAPQQSWVRI